jgi:hypothetical protein
VRAVRVQYAQLARRKRWLLGEIFHNCVRR